LVIGAKIYSGGVGLDKNELGEVRNSFRRWGV